MMYCPNCGRENRDGAKFCGGCGAVLNKMENSVNSGGGKSDTATSGRRQKEEPEKSASGGKPKKHRGLSRVIIVMAVVLIALLAAAAAALYFTKFSPQARWQEEYEYLLEEEEEVDSNTDAAESSKSVPVKVTFTGSVASGYYAGEIVCSPEEITISGPEDIVEQVEYAVVTVSDESVTESINAEYEFTLTDDDGNEIDMSTLTCSTDTIAVAMSVGEKKTVPLTVTIVEGGGATEDDITVEIDPESISVSGDSTTLAELDSIDLGTIDLSEILTTATTTKEINLPGTLDNLSGTTQATVKVTVSGLSVKTVKATQFTILNKPDNYTTTLVTERLNVTLRGTEEALEDVTTEDVTIAVDLSQIDFTTGSTGSVTIEAEVVVTSDDGVGAVGSYNVVVDVE